MIEIVITCPEGHAGDLYQKLRDGLKRRGWDAKFLGDKLMVETRDKEALHLEIVAFHKRQRKHNRGWNFKLHPDAKIV